MQSPRSHPARYATRPRATHGRTSGLVLVLAGLAVIGLGLALCHVSLASPAAHADCQLCASIDQVVTALPLAVLSGLVTVVVLQPPAVFTATTRTLLPCRDRAPPHLSHV